MKQPDDSASSAPAVWQEFLRLPLDRLKPSATQPRVIWTDEARQKMSDSVRAHGIIQPLIVRALPDAYYLEPVGEEGLHELCRVGQGGTVTREGTFPKSEAESKLRASVGCYEIIDGERRWRSAGECALSEAPVILRQLSDIEVMEIQLISAMQREELSPIEEGQAMARMLSLRDPEGNAIHTTESLAQKLGQTIRTIQRRVKLSRATGPIRAAVEAGTLPAKTADLLLGIPDEKLRERAAKAVLSPQYEAGPLSYSAAERIIARDYMVDLREATFEKKDATLVPIETDELGERVAGGGCDDCPLRAGNMQAVAGREGAGEVKSGNANMCLNPTCYARKKTAAWERWQEQHTDVTGRRRALSEQECLQLYSHGNQLNWTANMVDLKEHPDGEILKAGVETAPKWKEMVKGSEIEILVARDRLGKTHELVSKPLAITAAETNGHKMFKRGAVEPEKTDEVRKAEAAAQTREREIVQRIADAKMKALVTQVEGAKKTPVGFWQMLVEAVLVGEITYDVAHRRGLDEAAFEEDLVGERDSYIIGVLVDHAARNQTWKDGKAFDGLAAWAALYAVDLKEIEKAERAAIKQEETAAAEEADIDQGLIWDAPPAEDWKGFQWDADGCTNPLPGKLTFRKADKVSVQLFMAQSEKGYVTGYAVKVAGKPPESAPCRHTGPFFNGEVAAVTDAIILAESAMKTLGATASALERMAKYRAWGEKMMAAEPQETPAKKKAKKGGAK